MASPFGAAAPVWQDPFVEVLKFGMTHRNVGWFTHGDVEQTQDQLIHKNIFRIRGTIAATNYLRVPRNTAKGTQGLGLTGRYAYLQVRRVRDQPMTIHMDFVTTKKTSLRFTLSSIYHTLRSAGTVLRVPLRLDARWTVVVVDMVRLLELHSFNQYARDTYSHLKTITLCASMNVRNFFVSPTLYSPATLPASLRFPGDFGAHYCWLEIPVRTNSSATHQRSDPVKQEAIRMASTPDPAGRVRRSSMESTRVTPDNQEETVREVEVKLSPGTRDSNLRHDRNAILSKADQILRAAGVFDVGMESDNNQGSSEPLRAATAPTRRQRARVVSASTKAEWPDPILELDRIVGFSNHLPRMLLWIPGSSACVYTSSSTIIIREFDEGGTNSGTQGSEGSTKALKGTADSTGSAPSARESFLHGHSSAVCVLAVTTDGSILASAESPETKGSGIRLWRLASHECLTVVKAQAKGVHALCFSPPTKRRLLLCAVGRDESSRTQIFVWDCSSLQQGDQGALSATVSLMARQTSDFPIGRIAFSPYEQQDQYHLVSCGRENVRYWRVNPSSGHLTGCPVILNEYSRGTVFTDVAYDTIVETQPSNIQRVRPLYVTSSLGTLLVVDYEARQVLCVYQLHDSSINCLSVNEGFCVTGSDDCFLRVWPLDFTDFFLEAHHEAGVSCLDVSADGMKVIVGSRNNAIGVLDVADQQYSTVLRSHTKRITAMTTAPWGSPLSSLLIADTYAGRGTGQSEIVTASSDGTLRVWDASSGQQLYEFDIQNECITSLAASPAQVGIVAAGFASGCTRIFDVHRATNGSNHEAPSSMLREFWQHQSSICHLAFDSDAQHLYTSGAGRQLCLYDARDQDYMPLKMLLADFDPEDGHFVLSQDKKWLAVINGARRGVLLLDPCSLRVLAAIEPPIPSGAQEEALKLVRFSNSTAEVLALSASDRLHIFSLATLTCVQSMPLLGQGGISTLVMSANSKYMATGGGDSSLRVWNWDDKGRISRMHQSFLGHAGKIQELAFTKDGKHIVATGESSAVCLWEFHGDPRPESPRIRLGAMEPLNGAGTVEGNDSVIADSGDTREAQAPNNDPEKESLAESFSSKSSFKLSLEADALMLDGAAPRTGVDSVLSSQHVSEEVPVISVSESTYTRGSIDLSRAIAAFDPSLLVWAFSSGKLVYSEGSVVVVEDLASGQQEIHEDCHDSTDVSTTRAIEQAPEVMLMQPSASGDAIATISSRLDFISIRSLATGRNELGSRTVIRLLPGTSAVTALAFGNCQEGARDRFVCAACEIGGPQLKEYVIVLASTASSSVLWSSAHAQSTSQIVARSSHFYLFSSESNSVASLELGPDDDSPRCPSVQHRVLIDAFPTQVQRVTLYDGRYLVGIDNDRYCYFYDLRRGAFVATTQLLVPSKANRSAHSVDTKASNSSVAFFEWASSSGKALFITGSTAESRVYVHALPMVSTKHSSRVLVDWQRLARGGVSLLHSVPLSGGPLRSLTVDPARDVGIAATEAGTVFLVHLESPPTVKVLRETAISSGQTTAQMSWALDGAVLLTSSPGDGAIRVWLPELTKELTRFQVAAATCTCFAVNPFPASVASVAQSMVMAGYSDGSLRVFDLREMRLLSRFELAPSTGKSARDTAESIDRIVFVGASAALVVCGHRILLVEFSRAMGAAESAPITRPTRSVKRKPQGKGNAKAKASTQEVVYRELSLLSTRESRRRRLPSVAKAERTKQQLRIGAIDVMPDGDACVHPFLVVLCGGADGNAETRCVAFAASEMSVTSEELAPTDKWRLGTSPLVPSVAVFTASPPGAVRVIYPCRMPLATTEQDTWWWGLEVRDCVKGCALQRLAFAIADPFLDCPVQIHRVTTAVSSHSPEAEELLLLADSAGRLGALDSSLQQLIPIATPLPLCAMSRSNALLSHGADTFVGRLSFH